MMLQKLKQENDTLRDALEQARAADVVMLKKRLRAAQADILHYKQLNSELRERIQALEDKIFLILSDRYEKEGNANMQSSATIRQTLKEKLKQKHLATQLGFPHHDTEKLHSANEDFHSSSLNDRLSDTSALFPHSNHQVRLADGIKVSYIALQNRCRHFESLAASYDKTIRILQEEAISFRKTYMTSAEETKSVEFVDDLKPIPMETPPLVASEISDGLHLSPKEEIFVKDENLQMLRNNQFVKRLVEEARSIDQRTIQELAKEVKRLSRLLPSDFVDQDDNNINEDINHSISVGSNSSCVETTSSRVSEVETVDSASIAIHQPDDAMTEKDLNTWISRCWRILRLVTMTLGFFCLMLILLIEVVPSFLMTE